MLNGFRMVVVELRSRPSYEYKVWEWKGKSLDLDSLDFLRFETGDSSPSGILKILVLPFSAIYMEIYLHVPDSAY